MLKKWLRKHNEASHSYRWDIVEAVIISTLFAASFVFGFFLRGVNADHDIALWKSLVFTPEPEICALCRNGSGISYHAPVLVDLSTGEVGELQVYDIDLQHRNEFAEEQSTGTFSLINVAGLTGYRDTGEHSSNVTLPENKEPVVSAHFCRDCRAALASTATEGYILADLYNPCEIATYAIEENTVYMIRDYTVFISSQDKSGNFSIHVTGSLSMKEG